MMTRSKTAIIFVMAACVALSACGKKGDVKPPRSAENAQINEQNEQKSRDFG